MWRWNRQMWKKKKGTIECDNEIVTCEVGTVQYKDGTVKTNVTKSKGATECDKRTVTCEVRAVQCEDETVKCEKNVTWYNKLPISGYRTRFTIYLGKE